MERSLEEKEEELRIKTEEKKIQKNWLKTWNDEFEAREGRKADNNDKKRLIHSEFKEYKVLNKRVEKLKEEVESLKEEIKQKEEDERQAREMEEEEVDVPMEQIERMMRMRGRRKRIQEVRVNRDYWFDCVLFSLFFR